MGLTAAKVGVNYIDVNMFDGVHFLKIQIFYGPGH